MLTAVISIPVADHMLHKASRTLTMSAAAVRHGPAHCRRKQEGATQFPTIGLFERNANNFKGTRNTKAQKSWSSRAEPAVRIPFPPADSQSLSRSRFSRSRTPLFRAGLGSWLGDRVSRDAPGSPLRANGRQYLCRTIFQYRSADEVVSENAAPVPTKLGLLRDERAWIFEFGSGLSKAEQGPLVVPGKRQT